MREQVERARQGRPSGTSAEALRQTSTGSALRNAAARIEAAVLQLTDLLPSDDIPQELNVLIQIVQDSEASFDSEETDPGLKALRWRLLQMLRTETVAEWTRNPHETDAQSMIDTLSGFERAQAILESQQSAEFTGRLLEPFGLDLLLEVAHDLRSPLTSIAFLSETMLRGQSGPLSDVQQRQLGIIYSAALGLINTASDVIEFARSGVPISTPSTFSIYHVLESVRDIVLPMAEEKGVKVRLMSAAGEARVGHPVTLSRVILNLTTNALKFTDEGVIDLEAHLLSAERIRFCVRDTGPGISPEALQTLYQPFRRRQGGRAGYHFSGTGLGLSICRKLINAMGGELLLETRLGQGTCFFFEIELPPLSRPLKS